MKRMRLVSLLLAAAMLLAFLPVSASAAVVCGDLDGDGSITSSDARRALRWSVKLETEASLAASCKQSGYNFKKAADVDLDGNVTASDARLILRGSVKLENTAAFGMNESQIYRSGNFYLSGTMNTGKSDMNIDVAETSGSVYFGTELDFEGAEMLKEGVHADPVPVGIMKLGEATYLTYPEGKCSLLMDASTGGLELGESLDLIDSLRLVTDPNATPVQMKTVELNGETVVCNVYKNAEGLQEWHYMNQNKLVQIECYNAAGALAVQIQVNSFSANVPAAMCSLPADYTQYSGGLVGMLNFLNVLLTARGLSINDLNMKN